MMESVLMGPFSKERGNYAWRMGSFIKGCFQRISFMEPEGSHIVMGVTMKDNGLMILEMASENK